MAGLYAVFGPPQRARVERAADRLTFSAAGETRVVVADDGCSFAWTSFDDPALFGPAHDAASGVRLAMAGRVAWDEPDWQRAEALTQYEGGLSGRLLLDAYLRDGARALERPDGPAAVFLWDPRTREAHLVTDHLGYHPVFLYRPEDPARTVIATHPDAIADDPEVETTTDEATFAEVLAFWRPTPPHTYYREVKYARPARHWRWDLREGRVADRAYWEPHQGDPFPSLEAGAEELAAALTRAVRVRTLPRLSPTVCYISGGVDSRTILFAAADPEHTVGVNMYEVPNTEAEVSRRICEAAGVRYEGFARDFDYYPRWLDENARWSGAMWSAEDGHFLGTWERARALGARTVTTGCTADRVFKGTPLERRFQQLFGKNLPVRELRPQRVLGFPPNSPGPLPAAHAEEIRARFEAWFEGTPRELKEDRDWLLVEDRRVRPNCYGSSVSGPIMYRIFPYDTFLADRAVADCYGRTRAAWKVNGDLWGHAVARVAGNRRHIPVAHYGWRTDASTPEKLLAFARGWVGRRLAGRRNPGAALPGPATDGSWPSLSWYLSHSPTLLAQWHGVPPEDRALLTRAWGWGDPWDPASPPRDANAVFRMLTMAAHLRQRRGEGDRPAGGSALAPAPEGHPAFATGG